MLISFSVCLYRSVNKPYGPTMKDEVTSMMSCYEYYSQYQDVVRARNMTLGKSCDDIKPHKEKYRKHGLINIYLTPVCSTIIDDTGGHD